MKVEIKTRFVLHLETDQNNNVIPLTDIVFKNLAFAHIAGEFEKMYQALLIQNSEIMIAELLSIEEIEE